MGAVVHAHPPNATAMACADRRLATTFQAEAIVSLGPQLGWVPFAMPGSEKLGAAIGSAARRANAALLAGHGVLAWGVDIAMAMARLELVEHLARITLLAPGAGVTPLAATEVAVLTAKHRQAGLAAPGVES
jgi:L-fuculose-phosphate aldolase